MDDLLERGMLKTYYWELSKMYYDWAFLLTLNILHTKGENISGEIFHELKDNVEARFPDIRQNPLFADEQGQKEIAIVDIDYTQEKQGLLERLLDDCLVTL
jgi:hypothetical protein